MRLPYDTRADDPDGVTALPITQRGKAAGGTCTLSFGPVPQGYNWRVNYLTITNDGALVPTVNVYTDSAALPNLLDGTQSKVAVAPYNPARLIGQGQTLVVVWTGASANSNCSARLEYDQEAA